MFLLILGVLFGFAAGLPFAPYVGTTSVQSNLVEDEWRQVGPPVCNSPTCPFNYNTADAVGNLRRFDCESRLQNCIENKARTKKVTYGSSVSWDNEYYDSISYGTPRDLVAGEVAKLLWYPGIGPRNFTNVFLIKYGLKNPSPFLQGPTVCFQVWDEWNVEWWWYKCRVDTGDDNKLICDRYAAAGCGGAPTHTDVTTDLTYALPYKHITGPFSFAGRVTRMGLSGRKTTYSGWYRSYTKVTPGSSVGCRVTTITPTICDLKAFTKTDCTALVGEISATYAKASRLRLARASLSKT